MQVTLHLTGLEKFQKVVSMKSPVVVKILKQWGMLYRSFAQLRFDKFSKGGGNWPPLKPATIARRRRGKGQGKIAILRDTGLLFQALQPVFIGQGGGAIEEIKGEFSVTVGYGGGTIHKSSKKTTIADIASFHNFGMGHNPMRRIIEQPDDKTKDLMAQTAESQLAKTAHETVSTGPVPKTSMSVAIDPFTLVYNALWALMDESVPLQQLVKATNRIRFNQTGDRGPIKEPAASADLPELLLSTVGTQAINMHSSSCATMISRQYSWMLSTGDYRLHMFLYPVQFALFAAMADWRGNLTALLWNDEPFVRKADLTNLTEGDSNPEANRGIKGWSSLWACTVEMHFSTQDLILFNRGDLTALLQQNNHR